MVKHCNFMPNVSSLSIIRINLPFPRWFEKLRFHCTAEPNSEIIIRGLTQPTRQLQKGIISISKTMKCITVLSSFLCHAITTKLYMQDLKSANFMFNPQDEQDEDVRFVFLNLDMALISNSLFKHFFFLPSPLWWLIQSE